MAWIELHDTVFGHRKTRRMSALLGTPCVPLIGHLTAVWCWALTKTEDGSLPDVTPSDIELAAEWVGEAGAFTQAMIDARYIDMVDGIMVLHDWIDYTARLMEKRSAAAEKQKRYRLRLKENALRNDGDVTSTPVTNVTETVTNVTRYHQPTNQPTNHSLMSDLPESDGNKELDLDIKDECYPKSFIEAYEPYPVKVGKADAAACWKRMKPDERAALVKAIGRIAAFTAEFPAQLEYTMNAGRFFRSGWRDWVNGEPQGLRTKAEANQRKNGGVQTYAEPDLPDFNIPEHLR